ncbi:CII-like transcriptional activator [Rhodobacteraceae phage LS06-2018-MD06]|jgi:hypothetical protein|nr:CII-like transcriptional activator [Rhodobacteraceae phage LS06-2018-MD06]
MSYSFKVLHCSPSSCTNGWDLEVEASFKGMPSIVSEVSVACTGDLTPSCDWCRYDLLSWLYQLPEPERLEAVGELQAEVVDYCRKTSVQPSGVDYVASDY